MHMYTSTAVGRFLTNFAGLQRV